MSLENPNTNTPENQEKIKKGTALKALVAATNGILSRNIRKHKEDDVFTTIIEKTGETYTSLEDLEKRIDPSGNLSGELEDRIISGLSHLHKKIEQWAEAELPKSEERVKYWRQKVAKQRKESRGED